MSNRIIYIGNELKIVKMLSKIKEIDIVAVICEEEKVSNKDIEFYGDSISIYKVKNKKDIEKIISCIKENIDYAIMYSFSIIIPATVVEQIEIYNFHPGDLRNNRGSSPINWSILRNENVTKMSLHKIDDKIDCGELICEHECVVYPMDIPSSLRERMEGEILSMMQELVQYRRSENKKVKQINQGIYRKRISETDYTITDADDYELICAKIRSQYDYNGAILWVGDVKYYISSLEEYEEIKNKKDENK